MDNDNGLTPGQNKISVPSGNGAPEETVESLEGSGKSYSKEWMSQRIKRLTVGAGFAAAAIIAMIILRSCTHIFGDETHTLAEAIVSAPKNLFDLMGVGIVVFAFLMGIGMVLSQTSQILSGPPKAGKTPEQTIRQFYKNAVFPYGYLVGAIDVAAFVCLLDAAKRDFGDWTGFHSYWVDINRDIVKQLEKRSGKAATNTTYEVKAVRFTQRTQEGSGFEVELVFHLKFGADTNPMFKEGRSVTFGPYAYLAHGEVIQVGDRWYLTSGKWNGGPA